MVQGNQNVLKESLNKLVQRAEVTEQYKAQFSFTILIYCTVYNNYC